jgi:hypothetical protein
MLVFGLVVAGVILVGGLVFLAIRQWKKARMPANPAASGTKPAVLEGEFVVIREGRRVAH